LKEGGTLPFSLFLEGIGTSTPDPSASASLVVENDSSESWLTRILLVLSEFTGASPELFNALIVNPHDARGVAEAIEKGLKMSNKEKMALNSVMRERVRTHDADYWANRRHLVMAQ